VIFLQCKWPSIRKRHQKRLSIFFLLLSVALLFSIIPHYVTYAQDGGNTYLPLINNDESGDVIKRAPKHGLPSA